MKRYRNFYQGNSSDAYKILGCHKLSRGKYRFSLWAPNASRVSIVGDFNNWLYGHNDMQRDGEGIWQIELEGVENGDLYKFAIVPEGRSNVLYKADPYAFYSELRPGTASAVFDGKFKFTDGEWMSSRGKLYDKPVSIYEVHAGSWRKHPDGRLYTYRELARHLVPYVKEMGYTHVEFMPLSEYPYDGSWGYQATGYFSPTSRYGTPDDLKYLVNCFHENGIGVILDWVPAHFCKDAHGLADFDGSCCYESADPFKKEHEGWGTRIFDYSRYEVQSFLVSNAVYWLKEFHFDGLRADAVASMLYLDYDKKEGQWRPNAEGGNINTEAVAFLRKLSEKVFGECGEVLFIAEESTAFPKVTYPTYDGGLGFNFKWNMGWMNDVLSYISTDTLFRAGSHDKMTFSMCYAFSENFILPFSHDEVVHMKGSLISKIFGEYDDKFAQLKALLAFQYAHPGKKLTFMGTELAQWNEWSEDRELDWVLLTYPKHDAYRNFVRQLNFTYKENPALYADDGSWQGFTWRLVDASRDSVFAFERNCGSETVLAVINFSQFDYYNYGFTIQSGSYRLLLDSDALCYGGKGLVQDEFTSDKDGLVQLTIPAFSAQYYKKIN